MIPRPLYKNILHMRTIGCNDNDTVIFFFKPKRKRLRVPMSGNLFLSCSHTKTVFFLLLISQAYLASETLPPGLGYKSRIW